MDQSGDPVALGDPGPPLLDLALDLGALGEARMVADELGDGATRDEWVRALITRHRGQSPNTARIYEILGRATGPGKPVSAPDNGNSTLIGWILN